MRKSIWSSFTQQFSTPDGTYFVITTPVDEEWSICSALSHSDEGEMEHAEVDATRESGSEYDSVDIGIRRVATEIAIHEEELTGRDTEFFPLRLIHVVSRQVPQSFR